MQRQNSHDSGVGNNTEESRACHISADFSFFLPWAKKTNFLPPIPSPPLSSSPLPPFRSRPLNRCKLPQWGLVLSPSRQTIWCILESKNAALVAAVFVDFPKNKCNFMPENKLDIVRRVQFLTGRRPMRNFSRGAVATIAQYGSRGSRRLHCHEKKCQVAPKKVPIRCPKNDTL